MHGQRGCPKARVGNVVKSEWHPMQAALPGPSCAPLLASWSQTRARALRKQGHTPIAGIGRLRTSGGVSHPVVRSCRSHKAEPETPCCRKQSTGQGVPQNRRQVARLQSEQGGMAKRRGRLEALPRVPNCGVLWLRLSSPAARAGMGLLCFMHSCPVLPDAFCFPSLCVCLVCPRMHVYALPSA